jgi:hypothetical protein
MKEDSVNVVPKPRTNSGLNFVLGLSATVRDLSTMTVHLKSRKDLETKEEPIRDLSAA